MAGLGARKAAVEIVTRVLDDRRGLDGLLDSVHGPSSFKALSEEDRSLVRAMTTILFRHKGEIDHALSRCFDRPPPKGARHLRHTLAVAASQILFMNVPDSAAVNLAVAGLKGDQRSKRFAALGNAVLRRLGREGKAELDKLESDERARLNTPPWLWKRLRRDFGKERAAANARRHLLPPVLDLTVAADVEIWAERLGGHATLGNSLRLDRPERVSEFPGYNEGAWWVQDLAASLPVLLLGDISGKRVADLCAAPGGKTAQLAAMGARVTALELSASRLERLRENMARLNLHVDCVEADLRQWVPEQPFDAVLLDAPCSSTGTIRRHPDVQWTKDDAAVAELAQLQFELLQAAIPLVKPGGTLVFANCSLLRAEGEDLAARALIELPKLELQTITPEELFGHEEFLTGQGTVRTLPSHFDIPGSPPEMGGLDGFFAARFIRKT